MFIKQIQIESLGNSTYLVGDENARVCAVVDPVRDVDLYIDEALALGCKITHTLDTHVHNDFVSGSRELAARTGSIVCASGAAGLIFEHRALRDGDVIDVGEVKFQVVETPGHTPEHVSYLATDTARGGGPHALFSGGALLVGGVARSDLLGKEVAPFLGHHFFQTIRTKLSELEDDVAVYPTHGGGSFCLAKPSGSGATTTTIGLERRTNAFFQAKTEDEFLELALSDLPPIPAYYSRMAAINTRGPRILGSLPQVFPLSPNEVWVRVQEDASAIDVRSPEAFVESHVPRSYSVPFGDSAGTWVGWLVEPDKPVILIADDDPAVRQEMVRQLIRIGYDIFDGYLDGGMESWTQTRLPVARLDAVTPAELYAGLEGNSGIVPLDVRFGYEWRTERIPGTVNIELGDLARDHDTLSKEASYASICAAGVRASTGASVLQREGFENVVLMLGGTNAWKDAGLPLERGES